MAIAVVVALIAGVAGLIVLGGARLPDVARAAVDGAFGTPFALFSATLKRATPLLLVGVAAALSFRAGVLNIGGDGQFLVGAAAATAVGTRWTSGVPVLDVVLLMVAGAAAGAAWAWIAAVLRRRFTVQEVVSTLLLNFVAADVVAFLVRGPLQEPARALPQSAPIVESARVPLLIPGQRLHAGFVIGLMLALLAWWIVQRTAAGFRIQAVGANAATAASAGLIDVPRVQAGVLIASGAIAGLAGAGEVGGTTYALYDGISPGYGYTGVAIAVLAGVHWVWTPVVALLFGALGAAADAVQRDAGVPAELATVISGVAVLGVLVVRRASTRHVETGT